MIGDVAPCSLVDKPDTLKQCHDGSDELATLVVSSPPTHDSVPSQSRFSESCPTSRVFPQTPDPDPEVNASTCDAFDASFGPREDPESRLEPIADPEESVLPNEYPVALLASESPPPAPERFTWDPEAIASADDPFAACFNPLRDPAECCETMPKPEPEPDPTPELSPPLLQASSLPCVSSPFPRPFSLVPRYVYFHAFLSFCLSP